jgi:hypothetical protein
MEPRERAVGESSYSSRYPNEKARNRDRHCGCVVDINGADEIALLSFELQAALKTIAVHGKRAAK